MIVYSNKKSKAKLVLIGVVFSFRIKERHFINKRPWEDRIINGLGNVVY